MNPATETPASETAQAANGRVVSDRSGQDERRRGWFWHWNGIVTQYAPLIGLKGVGLLNSYTVWTDRREDSPHRGYAFPSQQSEANFYGEDRAELITINKILVALDLIEIRKEMVRKVDAQGRRWKVPQNFYRVKDRPNGLELTTQDVIKVIELADRDQAVYRYIRKVFSSKFEPIDSDNVWHQILTEIAEHPTWQKLVARAAKQEAQASARSKAGHRSRARQQQPDNGTTTTLNAVDPQDDDPQEPSPIASLMTNGHSKLRASTDTEQAGHDAAATRTSVEGATNGSGASAEPGNRGSGPADDDSNSGLREPERGNVGIANNGHEGSVEPGNTTYYETSTTTTTTTSHRPDGDGETSSTVDSLVAALGQPDPDLAVGRARTDAPPDREALQQPGAPAADAALDARVAGEGSGPPQRGLADGGAGPVGDPSPLVVSLYEAANDRRATPLERVLLSELERDAGAPARAAGLTGADWVAAALREAVGSGSAFVAPKRIREIINRWAATGSGPRAAGLEAATNGPQNAHANGHGTLSLFVIKRALGNMLGDIERVAVHGEVVTVQLGGESLALAAGRVAEIEQRLSDELGRRIRLKIEPSGGGQDGQDQRGARDVAIVARISARDARQGEQLWNALLDMLAAEGAGADLLRLRAVVPLGQAEDGAFLLGAPTRLAARLLEGRYRVPVERALEALLDTPVQIAVLNPGQWTVTD